jgi:hypothetical protein
MNKVSLSMVESFLKSGLQKLLREDVQHHRIFKEADLECCFYFHLRNFLQKDERWRIFGRKHSRKTGHYTDLVVYKRFTPCIAIELKWRKDELGKKDRSALGKALSKLKVKKAYFFSVLPDESTYARSKKIKNEKRNLFEFPIGLSFTGVDREKRIEQWEHCRKRFRN